MEKAKLTKQINIRLSEYEYNFIKGLSNIYASGNMSVFFVYAALNCERKFLTQDELRESDRRIIKGKKRGA